MSVKRLFAMSTVVLLGCGPRAGDSPNPTDASWLIGVYSLEIPGVVGDGDPYVERISLDAGGLGEWARVSLQRPTDERPLSWELTAAKEAAVYPSPFDEKYDEWDIVRPGSDCNTLEHLEVNPNGSTGVPVPLYRGEVCARQPQPSLPDQYENYWCDEPPPPCDGA